jgi:hypothetical protein
MPFPKTGELCFRSDQKVGHQYIRMSFKNDEVEGDILTLQSDGKKKQLQRFGGGFVSDSTLQIHIPYQNGEVLEEWTIRRENHKIFIQDAFKRKGVYSYTILPREKMPTYSQYTDVTANSGGDKKNSSRPPR